jgi:hypothetical protein
MIFLLLLFFPFLSSNASTNGVLRLTSHVPIVNELSISPNSQAVNLNIAKGEVGTVIADVLETSNNPQGYSVQISSKNAGKLINSNFIKRYVRYKLSYHNKKYFTPTSTLFSAKSISSLPKKISTISSVRIKFAGVPTALSGNYEDVLTLSIISN